MALSEGDLAEVRDFLLPVRNKWYDIGLELTVDGQVLEEIRAKYSNFRICLREMLRARLRSAGNPLTWEDLTKAKGIDKREQALEGESGVSLECLYSPDASPVAGVPPQLLEFYLCAAFNLT